MKLHFFVVVTLFLSIAGAYLYPREKYERMLFDHLIKYNITLHSGDEFVRRVNIYANNFDRIEEHEKTCDTLRLAVNQWTHLTLKEFHEAVCIGCWKADPADEPEEQEGLVCHPAPTTALPASVDWSASRAVTSVKYQGSCGSCWAFSAVGALEGAHYLKYGATADYSEQQLISCDTTCNGCGGGNMNVAFNWVKGNLGLTTNGVYPCSSCSTGATGTCVTGFSNDGSIAPVSVTRVKALNVTALMAAVAKQPVSVAVDAGDAVFQSYTGGIITSGCGTVLNHAVLLVGYGISSTGVQYWKVKNSWGTGWGESGYFRVKLGTDNQCGILSAASYPNL